MVLHSRPPPPAPSAQTDNEDTSDVVSENEPLEEQHAASNPQDAPDKPENGWDENKQHYYENGVMVVDKDVFIPDAPNNRKTGIWVRFDQGGNLIKGEDYRYGGWYYFDATTGAMSKGIKYLSSDDKWVYYDVSTGKMAHGEAYLHYDKEHTGWYYFDQNTGAMAHDFVYIRKNKQVGVLRQDHGKNAIR